MNRRELLVGIATTVLATGAIPIEALQATTNAELWYKQWLKDIVGVLHETQDNVLLYGVGVTRQIEEYPYLESIHPSKIYQQA